MAALCSIAWIYHNLFSEFIVSEYLGYFHSFAVTNNAAINILISNVSFPTYYKHICQWDKFMKVEFLGQREDVFFFFFTFFLTF